MDSSPIDSSGCSTNNPGVWYAIYTRHHHEKTVAQILAYKGFETREASDGAEGLKIAEDWPPDLVIVDIEMPGMNGCEFVLRFHANAKLASTPIIFYPASYETSAAEAMASVGWKRRSSSSFTSWPSGASIRASSKSIGIS